MIIRKTSLVKLALASLLPLGLSLAACGGTNATTATTDTTAADTAQCTTNPAAEGCPIDASESPAIDHSGHGMGSHAMDVGPADATYDLRFIDAMIVHHEGAIVMAEAALEHSQRDEIRQLAEDIIAAQQTEIAQMKDWRQAWYPDAPQAAMMYHAEMKHDMPMTDEMASSMRMDVDLGSADEEFDLRFIDAMIPHHEGALVMAEDLKAKSTRPEMQTLAEEIIAAQQGEIAQMQEWRQAWYGQ